MTVVPREGDRPQDRWLSHEDYARFKKGLVRDVRWASKLFASTQSEEITRDVWRACTGIESYLDPEMSRRLEDRNRAHVRAILAFQRIIGMEELGNVAEISSRGAREEACCRARDSL